MAVLRILHLGADKTDLKYIGTGMCRPTSRPSPGHIDRLPPAGPHGTALILPL